MSNITFKRVTPGHCRVHDDHGNRVGDVYRQRDILSPGSHYYVIHLLEDPRGPLRVFDRARIRDEAQRRYDSHPYL